MLLYGISNRSTTLPDKKNIKTQNPRMIAIPEEIQGLIKRLLRHTRWDKAAIQDVAVGMLTEIQRQSSTVEQEMWSFIQYNIPEIGQYEERSLNPTTMVVEEHKEGQATGRIVEIPPDYHEEIHYMLDELDTIENTAPLVGGVIMGMNNKVDQAIAKINTLLRTRIPECADGTWHIDPIRMVAIEGGIEQYQNQSSEESSEEN